MKELYRKYKRASWYFSVFLAEVSGVLEVVKYVGLATIALGVVHIILPVWVMIGAGIVMLFGGIGIGVILVKMGAVEIATDLGNSQNTMQKEILERAKRIEERLK